MLAEQRASQLFESKTKDIPELAIKYAKFMCTKVGGCAEVIITAYSHYAQIEEKLKCNDSLYKITNEDLNNFNRIKNEL